MDKIRVLLADDSLVVRRVIMEEIAAQPDLEVAGIAANGRIALERFAELRPDLVILDIEMPELDGLAALVQIRRTDPRTPIIMFSSLTVEGAAATFDALARGATDFFAKPSGGGGLEAARKVIRQQLVPAIRELALRARKPLRPALLTSRSPGMADIRPAPSPSTESRSPGNSFSSSVDALANRSTTRSADPGMPNPSKSATPSLSSSDAPPPTVAGSLSSRETSSSSSVFVRSQSLNPSVPRGPLGRKTPLDLVAIGASTGGPNALADLFSQLPAKFPVPIVIVQHMPPMFTQLLAERLSRASSIPTEEAKNGTTLQPGCAYVAPGDFHLTIARVGTENRLVVQQGPPENGCRPSFDPLLRSIAHLYGRHAITVVLTGMGQDGLKGCEAIRTVAGQILVQDEASSVVWGMPGAVARAGLADHILPLDRMADEITRRVRLSRG